METVINLILWVTAIAQFVVAVMSFINGGLARRTIIASLMMISGAIFAIILTFNSLITDENAFFFNQFIMIVCCCLFYLMTLLGISYVHITSKSFYTIAVSSLIPMLCMMASIVFRIDLYFPSIEASEAGKVTLTSNPLGLLVIGMMIVTYVSIGIVSLVIARKQASSALGKKLIRNIIIGITIGTLAVMIFNLANAEVHELHPIGPIGMLVMTILIYSALVKHGDDEL